MDRRVLIMGIGTGASNNLIRSFRRGAPELIVVGCHHDRFILKQSLADRNYLIPASSHPGLVDALCRVIDAEKIDFLIPNSDGDVEVIAGFQGKLPCRVFLPALDVIEMCQDKFRLTQFLRERAIPAPITHAVTDLASVDDIFERLAPRGRLWCRMRKGASSLGVIPVTNPEQARTWIRCWEELRGFEPSIFTLSEFLPGRDFAVQSLWKDGRLVLIKTCERLSYLGGKTQPSGTSSIAALAKTVREPGVVEVCTAAVRALDSRASGVFSVDLKEDERGEPCITEINVGRLITGTNMFDFTPRHNMAVTYVRLALDEPLDIDDPYDAPEDYYMVRDFDTPPGVFHANEFFEGIEDARG